MVSGFWRFFDWSIRHDWDQLCRMVKDSSCLLLFPVLRKAVTAARTPAHDWTMRPKDRFLVINADAHLRWYCR